MNLYELIKGLEKIALTQPNIRTAKDGSITDIMNNNPEIEYGVFVVTQNTHRSTENTDEYGLTLFYVDRLVDDLESNRLSIQSIGKEQLENIVKLFCELYEVDMPDVQYVPFTQRFVDECAGVYAQMSLVLYGGLCPDGGAASRPMIKFLQAEKVVDIFENGTVNVFPDEGYDGIERVIVNTNVKINYTAGDHIDISDDNVISAYGFAEEDDFNAFKDEYDETVKDIRDELKKTVKNDEYGAKISEIEKNVSNKVNKSDYEDKVDELQKNIDKKVNKSDYDSKVDELEKSIDTKADWDDFYAEQNRVNNEFNNKVGYPEYNEDKKRLEDSINSKADASDFETKARDLQSQIDTKANTDDVNRRFSETNTKIDETKDELQKNIDKKVNKTDYDSKISEIESNVSKKVNRSEYEDKIEELELLVDTKADWDDLESEMERVDEALNNKVGYPEYNQKMNDLQSQLDSKGDASDFNSKVDDFKKDIDSKVDDIQKGLDSKVDKSEYNSKVDELQKDINTRVKKSEYDSKVSELESLIDTKADWDDFYAEKERVDKALEQAVNYADYNKDKKESDDRLTDILGDVEKIKKDVENIDETVLRDIKLKTINGESIKGEGNIEISGGSGTSYQAGTNITIQGNVISAPNVATKEELNNLPLKTINGQTIKGSGNIDVKADIDLKTVNGQSLKGTGNISTDIDLKTINGQSLKGTGNIEIQGGGEAVTVDTQLNENSTNPVENKAIFNRFKVIDSSLDEKVNKASYESKIAELEAADGSIRSDLTNNYWNAEQVKEYVDGKVIGGVNFFVDSVDGSLTAINADMWYGEKTAEKIRDYAFYKYDTLRIAYIPEIKSLGASAFEGCSSLNEIHCFGKAGSVGTDAFKGVAEVGTLYYPEGEDYSEWCNALPEGWNCFVEGHYLYADSKSISIPFVGSSVDVTVFYDGGDGWRIEEKSDWISVTPEQSSDAETTISITVGQNDGSIRSGEVVFTDGVISFVLNVTQSGVKVPDNEIWYRTQNGYILTKDWGDGQKDFENTIISHTYEDGIGKIVFENPVTKVGVTGKATPFASTNITEIMLPDTITSLGGFNSCTYLTGVKIPDECVEIQIGAFRGCTSISTVIFNEKIKTVATGAFYGCPFKEWNVPGIEIIENEAFESRVVESFIFNEGTEDIRQQFTCPVKTVKWPSTLKTLGHSNSNIKLFNTFPEELDFRGTQLETIYRYVFNKNKETKTYWFPDTLKKIDGNVFEGINGADFYFESITPPSISLTAFNLVENITVHIKPQADELVWKNEIGTGASSGRVTVVNDYE